jgi:hypothetical protein
MRRLAYPAAPYLLVDQQAREAAVGRRLPWVGACPVAYPVVWAELQAAGCRMRLASRPCREPASRPAGAGGGRRGPAGTGGGRRGPAGAGGAGWCSDWLALVGSGWLTPCAGTCFDSVATRRHCGAGNKATLIPLRERKKLKVGRRAAWLDRPPVAETAS